MLRHLYGEGKGAINPCDSSVPLTSVPGLDVKDLKTPALCVRCWRLADYVQLESLKKVATSSLGQHLDAMALLASSSHWDDGPETPPNWLTYLLEGLREVCHDDTTQSIHIKFAAFFWVTRFELFHFPETMDALERSQGVNKKLMKLLAFGSLDAIYNDDWIENSSWPEYIAERSPIYHDRDRRCSECNRSIGSEGLVFSNPLPVIRNKSRSDIGALMWCKCCADKFNENCRWPWRSGRGMAGNKVKLEAWSWSGNE